MFIQVGLYIETNLIRFITSMLESTSSRVTIWYWQIFHTLQMWQL